MNIANDERRPRECRVSDNLVRGMDLSRVGSWGALGGV